MAKRVVIAGILGGLTMFVWLFVAHEFLPLGELGVGEIANEGPVLSAMQSSIPQAGLFLFPGMGLGPNPTMAQRNAAMPAYMKKYEQSPHGILVYHPPSGAFDFGAALAREGAITFWKACSRRGCFPMPRLEKDTVSERGSLLFSECLRL